AAPTPRDAGATATTAAQRDQAARPHRSAARHLHVMVSCQSVSHNVKPINGRAGTEPRSTDRNYTAGSVHCIGGVCVAADRPDALSAPHVAKSGPNIAVL